MGLPSLEQSGLEAVEIAKLYGAEAIMDRNATERAAAQAFQTSRYVHLATHGRLNVAAPSFHCLYLAPDEKDDGILYAHEISQWDLRGLELLTMSACETTLARFDSSDNIRGLPASLLMAGVETIVGTLWEVEANASRHFFTTLYTELKPGTSRLDAFYAAQLSTRTAFPKHRDWGAFYLIGDTD